MIQHPQQHNVSQLPSDSIQRPLRFGIFADAHLMGPDGYLDEEDFTIHLARFDQFLNAMERWRPAFVVNLGDFACQASNEPTSPATHDRQLAGLDTHLREVNRLPCPVLHVLGNHDCGWIEGGEERLWPEDLWTRPNQSEDITKEEWLAATKMPGRFYAFTCGGLRFIILDGCASSPEVMEGSPQPGRGKFWIDSFQLDWLREELRQHPDVPKVVFCHQPLLNHHAIECAATGQPPSLKSQFLGNGQVVRDLLGTDGNVLACFSGHVHKNHHHIEDGVHYITLAALHSTGSYSRCRADDRLVLEGVGDQQSYALG